MDSIVQAMKRAHTDYAGPDELIIIDSSRAVLADWVELQVLLSDGPIAGTASSEPGCPVENMVMSCQTRRARG